MTNEAWAILLVSTVVFIGLVFGAYKLLIWLLKNRK